MASKFDSVHYDEYLKLPTLLDCQDLRSKELGTKAHDEMLFIIIHQVYELWFKQILHEISSIQGLLQGLEQDERPLGVVLARLKRIIEILNVMIEQIKVLETMTPLDFLDFRNYLIPASGFQSFQFRKVETILGLRGDKRLTYNNKHYSIVFNEKQKAELEEIESMPSLLHLIEKWLERAPFLETAEFNFKEQYLASVNKMVEQESKELFDTIEITEESKQIRIRMLEETKTYIATHLDEDNHKLAMEAGDISISHKALLAALMINLYRDEPLLRNPFNLLSTICEIDEMVTTWRYRHAQMVMRIIGRKMGTGGSVGYDYLRKTADQHRIFGDLNNITTLMIPRKDLPELPKTLRENLDFHYKVK
jgi:tryptophan 2,3-dioxygenase